MLNQLPGRKKLILFIWVKTLFDRIHARLSAGQFLIFSSIMVGITAGLAAVVLKTIVFYIHKAFTFNYQVPYQYELYLFFPMIGILCSVFYIKKVLKGKLGRGTSNVLYAISKKSAFLPRDMMYSHVITSGLTVGFGGSAGLEAPIVTTGAAIGSNYARTYSVPYKERVLLLACGAAAGISASFNAPVAAVLFAVEVLLTDAAISAFIPLLISAATGALCTKIILNEKILLNFRIEDFSGFIHIPFYALLGIFAGLISLYYTRVFTRTEKILNSGRKKTFSRAIAGGFILAFLILILPPLFGEGYHAIVLLSENKLPHLFVNSPIYPFIASKPVFLALLLLLLLVKPVATAVTIGSGGNGGNFAPSLLMGASLGYFFASVLNLTGMVQLPVTHFTLTAMAGILSGVFHAPLTAIFLIAEITGGYKLMIPLMIVSACSYAVKRYFEPYSIDTKKLALRGDLLTNDKDNNVLTSLDADKMIEKDFMPVLHTANLGQLIQVVQMSKRNIFPVVDAQHALMGIILLDDIREIMFKPELYKQVTVKELMRKAPAIIGPDDHMKLVMKKFDETGSWNLPVAEKGKYIGFISKSNVFKNYREQLIRQSIN